MFIGLVVHTLCTVYKHRRLATLRSDPGLKCAESDLTDSPLPSCSLKFMPMYSPIAPKTRRARSFTQEEEKFQIRYEEGYDLSNDPKYISWLHIHYPDEANRLCELVDPTEEYQSQQVALAAEGVVHKSGLSKLLQLPKPPAKCVPSAKKTCAKVLTSTENLKLIEKREKKERR